MHMAVVVGSNIIMVPQRNFCMGQRGAPYSLHPTAPTWSDSVGHESILRQTNRQADRQTNILSRRENVVVTFVLTFAHHRHVPSEQLSTIFRPTGNA